MRSLFLKNGANYLTFLRVAGTPALLFLTNNIFIRSTGTNSYMYFVLLYIVLCLSDFFDGKIARRFGLETRFGALFDLFADFFFVISMHIVIMLRTQIPVWFLIVILDRFFNFILTSKMETDYKAQKFRPKFDKLGRYLAVLLYILPFIIFVDYCFLHSDLKITYLLMYTITGVSVFTSCLRIWAIKSVLTEKRKCIKQI
ncbi:CDP-alcohol phosphatidyltransferase family protein [Anaerocolumna cellulosilytica]|uniref:CDP-alcohol phosphatidyltransferase family protein n=1 Tax=Anaerocolumna cellulosilytica TaxID=433286 RepID=UPI001621BD3B|nr:CDP-alcohol phosphatidyltransferase family protein [Anaerocolumna cellulosilytica]MBB5196735.1 CDP-diacylglycerol--glycerol-3-phosphate 3-phosphatidyltransferase [Anaerocolumna cellulosilytica]